MLRQLPIRLRSLVAIAVPLCFVGCAKGLLPLGGSGGGGGASQLSPFSFQYDFTASAPYTFNAANIQIASNLLSLVSIDQIDSDGTATGFGGGSHTNTAYTTSLGLDATGLTAGNGTFASRVINAGGSVAWSSIAFTTARPAGKPLPNSGATESGYSAGNAVMTSNVMLYHFDESSYSGVANEVVDSSGNAIHGTTTGGAFIATSGRFGNQVEFDGLNDGVRVSHAASLNLSNPFTVETWFNLKSNFSSAGNDSQTLFDKGTYRMWLDHQDGRLKMNLADSASTSWTTQNNLNCVTIIGFAEFLGRLYVSCRSPDDVFYCDLDSNGHCTTWASAGLNSAAGFSSNEGVTAVFAYNGYLYASSRFDTDGGVIWRCDPSAGNGASATVCDDDGDWSVSVSGLDFNGINNFTAYRGYLYAASSNGTDGGDVFVCNPALNAPATRCDSGDWSTSYSSGTTYNVAIQFAELNGALYVAMGEGSDDGDILICSNPGADNICSGGEWTTSYNNATYGYVFALATFNGRLYGGTESPAEIIYCNPALVNPTTTCESGDWVELTIDLSAYDSIETMAVYNGRLFAGTGWNALGRGDYMVCTPTGGGSTQDCDADADWSAPAATVANLRDVEAMYTFNGKFYAGGGGAAGQGDVLVWGNGLTVASSTTSWTSGSWYHAAATYDGTDLRLYVNGSNEATNSASITPPTPNRDLYIGLGMGNLSESLTSFTPLYGDLDEMAFYSRVLTSTELGERYRRGAQRVRFQLRSCDDNACAGETYVGPDGTNATYFSDDTSTSLTAPSTYSITLGVPANQYFQYRAQFFSDPSTLTTELTNVTIGPSHYDASTPALTTNTGLTYASLATFVETATVSHFGTVRYQLSPDSTNWYYHNGATWAPATLSTHSNLATEINTNASTFAQTAGAGQLYLRLYLSSTNGTQVIEVSTIDVTGMR